MAEGAAVAAPSPLCPNTRRNGGNTPEYEGSGKENQTAMPQVPVQTGTGAHVGQSLSAMQGERLPNVRAVPAQGPGA